MKKKISMQKEISFSAYIYNPKPTFHTHMYDRNKNVIERLVTE